MRTSRVVLSVADNIFMWMYFASVYQTPPWSRTLEMLSATGRATLPVRSFCPPPVTYIPTLYPMLRYCDVPGSPCLSKNKANQVCDSCFFKFLSRWLRTKGSLAPCLVAARTVRWRPRLTGTRQYIRTSTGHLYHNLVYVMFLVYTVCYHLFFVNTCRDSPLKLRE